MTEFKMWKGNDYWNVADNLLMFLYGLCIIDMEMYESRDHDIVASFCERMGKNPDEEI